MFELNTQRNLELLTHDKVNHAVFGDRRLMDPSREELAALDLDGVVAAVESQLRAGPLEVNIAGDVDPEELDAMITRYLGTAARAAPASRSSTSPRSPSSPSPFARWRPAIRRRANSDCGCATATSERARCSPVPVRRCGRRCTTRRCLPLTPKPPPLRPRLAARGAGE